MNFLIALLVGAASSFAFQPVGLWPLMPVAFAILCELIARAPSLRRALLIGWGFSVGQFCVGLNWIATAFTFQAAMPAWLGWVAVLLKIFDGKTYCHFHSNSAFGYLTASAKGR